MSVFDPRREFALRRKVREKTREAWIDCGGDPVKTQREAERACESLARQEYHSLIGAILLAVITQLIAKSIADFINDWLNRGIKIPSQAYLPGEPGYKSEFEDDWEDES